MRQHSAMSGVRTPTSCAKISFISPKSRSKTGTVAARDRLQPVAVKPPYRRAADDEPFALQAVRSHEIGEPRDATGADEHGIDGALARHVDPDRFHGRCRIAGSIACAFQPTT